MHHLEVFHCQVEAHVILPPYDAPCSSKSERPLGLESCTKVLGAWAMGAKVFFNELFALFHLNAMQLIKVGILILLH